MKKVKFKLEKAPPRLEARFRRGPMKKMIFGDDNWKNEAGWNTRHKTSRDYYQCEGRDRRTGEPEDWTGVAEEWVPRERVKHPPATPSRDPRIIT